MQKEQLHLFDED